MIKTVFLDMDGVLTDFRKRCGEYNCIKGKKVDWPIIKTAGSKFWEEMEWTAEGKEFFKWIKNVCREEELELFICSSVKASDAKAGRLNWLKKNTDIDRHHIILVNHGDEKAYYATPEALLIDDYRQNCEKFYSAGGQAIQFKAMDQAKNAIEELLCR